MVGWWKLNPACISFVGNTLCDASAVSCASSAPINNFTACRAHAPSMKTQLHHRQVPNPWLHSPLRA